MKLCANCNYCQHMTPPIQRDETPPAATSGRCVYNPPVPLFLGMRQGKPLVVGAFPPIHDVFKVSCARWEPAVGFDDEGRSFEASSEPQAIVTQ